MYVTVQSVYHYYASSFRPWTFQRIQLHNITSVTDSLNRWQAEIDEQVKLTLFRL